MDASTPAMEQVVLESRLRSPANAALFGSPGKGAASWGAILAGAFVAVSVSLILLALGSGFGFAAVSAWPERGVSAATFTTTSAIWLILTQWISASLGGYTAGRLRTRWIGTHEHEVFFRDTAHGLVTWSVATVLIAAVLTASALSVADQAKTLAPAAAAAATTYEVDKLFRAPDVSAGVSAGSAGGSAGSAGGSAGSAGGSTGSAGVSTGAGASGNAPSDAAARLEAAGIVTHDLAGGGVTEADRNYLANLVASRTGLAPADAQRRVAEFISVATQDEFAARQRAEAARKAAADAAIFTALSMLIGAFIASVSAALGGRLRDLHT